MSASRNRLAQETSPYLLQHADNPVHWHPWDETALARARETDKPILLSIGYSACHWCHVMAHESFEDEDVAALMNELFVNIKVDREERPDLDKIYQVAHQMIAQRPGGWPLTMFLTPDEHTPIFGGTYFPKEARHGLPGFPDLMNRVAGYYREHRDEIRQQGEAVREVFERIDATEVAGEAGIDGRPLERAREQLASIFDEEHGGFGKAPKFPHPTSIERLLRHWRATARSEKPDKRALLMVATTLQRMAQGGIYDHLGGGFSRYSVDDFWMIPHFEKMLYDNGPLLALYAQAWAVTNETLFERTARETAEWVMREMQSPEGGYYSSLDADSEGEEGKFYVWEPKEVRKLLSDELYRVFAPVFGLDREANFEGKWHLHTYRSLREVATKLEVDEDQARVRLDEARRILFEAREQRVRPGRDEKILTAWNGLMIRGMAIAARHLQRADLADSAGRAVDCIRDKLWDGQRLHASYKDGRARFNAYLDDYAFLLDGILELLQVRWRGADLEFAQALADVLLDQFQDPERGGFYFTARDHEDLLHRPRPLADEATPSGNGIAALALNRLGHLLGETRYIDAAEGTVEAAWGAIAQLPHAHCSLLDALEEQLHEPEIVILRGEADELEKWRRAALLVYAPRRMSFAIPAGAEGLPEALAARKAADGTVAYLCRGMSCSPPMASLAELTEALRGPG